MIWAARSTVTPARRNPRLAPDIAVRVVRSARAGNAAWTEWEMTGTRRDGVPHLMRGVFIFGVSDGPMRWGRVFLEPVDADLALR